MNVIVFIAVFGTLAQAWRWPWEKPDTPEWSRLSVTFLKYSGLPMTESEAIDGGWTKINSCEGSTYFVGRRYMLERETAVMLLFDSCGKIAGIQNGISKSAVGLLKSPWIPEGDFNVITAYFTNPQHICSDVRPPSKYLGDQLFLQTGPKSSNIMSIPFKQDDLAGTKWVRGGCFLGMGRHYWYNISANMDCNDFYPMFLLYNRDRLTGFGWVTQGNVESPRYEHPSPKRLKYGFFLSETRPKCIPSIKALTTQHVYLDTRPYLNFCVF